MFSDCDTGLAAVELDCFADIESEGSSGRIMSLLLLRCGW